MRGVWASMEKKGESSTNLRPVACNDLGVCLSNSYPCNCDELAEEGQVNQVTLYTGECNNQQRRTRLEHGDNGS